MFGESRAGSVAASLGAPGENEMLTMKNPEQQHDHDSSFVLNPLEAKEAPVRFLFLKKVIINF